MPTPEQIRQTDPISSILLSSSPTKKKNNFSSPTFPGLGCKASSVPAAIRTSANWEPTKLKKKRLRSKISGNDHGNSQAAAVTRQPSRGNVDVVDRINALAPRERSYNVRRMVTPEDNPFIESDTSFGIAHIRSDVSGSRHHRHVRHGLGEGLAEIVMLQSSLLMGRRSDGVDRYRDMRLDIDNMSYEDLLELSERIGYVSTGLRDEEIDRCLGSRGEARIRLHPGPRQNSTRAASHSTGNFYIPHTKIFGGTRAGARGLPHVASPLLGRTKLAVSTDLSPLEMERKCSICQEEYESDVETGKLSCGHSYHIHCIQQWLRQKNSCPICKSSATSQNKAAA